MTAEEFADLLEEYVANVRRDYSGRGMYGKTCVGFVDSPGINGTRVAVSMMADEDDKTQKEALARIFMGMKEDGMGKETIYYFPGMVTKVGGDDDGT